MVVGIERGWYERGLPVNEPEDVGRAILMCATANRGGSTHRGARVPFAGKIVYVAGGKSYEVEDELKRLEPVWLGEENSGELEKGQAYLWPQKSRGGKLDQSLGAALSTSRQALFNCDRHIARQQPIVDIVQIHSGTGAV